jgi:O-antigen/teichoic acid export membrane protein
VRSGVRWQTLAQAVDALLAVGVLLVLARLVTPHEFGVVALFVAVGSACISSLFSPVGSAIVVKQLADRRSASTAWWMAVGPAMLGCLAVVAAVLALSPGHEVRITALAVAASLPLQAATLVLTGILQQRLSYRGLAAARVTGAVGGNAAALAIAASGHGLTGLLARLVCVPLLQGGASCVVARWLPAAEIDERCVRSIVRYVRGAVGFNALNQVARRGDDVIVGSVLGPTSLGYYSVAYRFIELPMSQVGQVGQNVSLPALSLLHDPDRFRAAFLRAQKVSVWAVAPLGICSIAFGDVAVRALLGARWGTAGEIVRIFGAVAILQAAGTQVGAIYLAREATDLFFRWGAYVAPVFLVSVLAGLPWGPVGVAWAYLAFNVVVIYPEWAIPGPLIGLTPAMVASSLLSVVGGAFVVAAIGCAVRLVATPHGAIAVVGACVVAAIVYWTATLAIDRGLRRDAMSIAGLSASEQPRYACS